jgi:acylphosphatase
LPVRRIVIRGLVQGVGFRWWVLRSATRLGLAGWVRNLPDGAVEIEASGSGGALSEFEDLCRAGPPGAVVDSVETGDSGSLPDPGFRVIG